MVIYERHERIVHPKSMSIRQNGAGSDDGFFVSFRHVLSHRYLTISLPGKASKTSHIIFFPSNFSVYKFHTKGL